MLKKCLHSKCFILYLKDYNLSHLQYQKYQEHINTLLLFSPTSVISVTINYDDLV